MGWLERLKSLRDRRRLDQELDDELAAHLAFKHAALEREGLSTEEASRQAHLAVGNTAVWKEAARAEWTFPRLEDWWRDIVVGFRLLRKDRLFTAVALITLTLGIGANTAVFTIMNALLWRELPVREPDRLVRLRLTNLPPGERHWSSGKAVVPKERIQLSYPLFEVVAAQQQLFEGVLGVSGQGRAVVDVSGEAHRLRMSAVTGSYFGVLGVETIAGRTLRPEDDVPGGPEGGWAAVISDGAWSRLFGRDASAIGGAITIERIPFTVVGVAPQRFQGIHPGVDIEVWVPLSAYESLYPKWQWRTDPGMWMLQATARLKPGISLNQAAGQLTAMSASLLSAAKEPGLSGEDERHFLAMKLDAVPGRSGFSWLVESFGPALWMLLAAVAAVLLIAATNLTNLLLARSTARAHEISVRLALGASVGRIRRQLLIENSILAVAGTLGGVFFARWMASALMSGVAGPANSIQLAAPFDWRVAAFTGGILASVVVIAGWAPAWSAVRSAPWSGMSRHGAAQRFAYVRGGLIVTQVAFSLVLLAGAGLMLSSLRALLAEDTGFRAAGTVFVTPDLFNAGISADRMPRTYSRILDEVRRQPGVTAAAWSLHVPLTGGLQSFTIEVPGASAVPPMERMVFSHQVTDGYFTVLGIPLLAGRDFPPHGSAGLKSCLVSENLARKFFGSPEAAIGRRIKPGNLDWTEIVGVVADTKYQHVREPRPLTVYTSYWDQPTTLGMTLVVRTAGSKDALLTALRTMFRDAAGRVPFIQVRTIEQNVNSLIATERTLAWLLAGFAVFGVLLCSTGIAGLIAFSVQLRRREIGIRMALGATPRGIRRQFQRYAVVLAGMGIGVGLLLSYGLRRAVDGWLFRVEKADPWIWLGVVLVLFGAAVAAASKPARRASRLEPMEILRVE
jgi:putative ABC transport system permease protein